MSSASVTPHVCLYSKQSPSESKLIGYRGNLPGSLRLSPGVSHRGAGKLCARHTREHSPSNSLSVSLVLEVKLLPMSNHCLCSFSSSPGTQSSPSAAPAVPRSHAAGRAATQSFATTVSSCGTLIRHAMQPASREPRASA